IFYDARNFNKNLSNWDISRVTAYDDWCNGSPLYNNKHYHPNLPVVEKPTRGLFG
ncbi:BspA family leucine-rich repeat surface protein, partial [Mycoplasma bovis]|nr:BspA family leucine-rich repeat surface protein [Mycoplasmopsis bovis]MBT1409163.1 BspA family leucine-rich repeat surface protein [Mycoplasmopsis bovis]